MEVLTEGLSRCCVEWNESSFSWNCLHYNRFGGGAEARQRMETERSSSSSAKLTMHSEWTQAGTQYRPAEPLRSCDLSSWLSSVPKPLVHWHCLLRCWLTDWPSHWLRQNWLRFEGEQSGLISKLSHDVSGKIPKGKGDCGRIWYSSKR